VLWDISTLRERSTISEKLQNPNLKNIVMLVCPQKLVVINDEGDLFQLHYRSDDSKKFEIEMLPKSYRQRWYFSTHFD